MHDTERDRIFGDWLAGHKGILFKVVHAYAFEHADRQDLFQEIVTQVWRSVDAFRGDVNKTLLHLALRQEQAKLQTQLRRERWIAFVTTAFIVASMARSLSIMIYRHDDDVLSGWDYAIPVVGAAAALLWVRMMYVRQRAQAVREQRFGDSLRDQINRQLAQLDYGAMRARLASLLGTVLLPIVSAFAMILASWRINVGTFSSAWLSLPIVFMICWSIICVGGAFWWTRRLVQRKTLPRKRRLDALLKELDGQ